MTARATLATNDEGKALCAGAHWLGSTAPLR